MVKNFDDVQKLGNESMEASLKSWDGLMARGRYNGAVLEAAVLGHAPDHPTVWPEDR